MSESELDEFDIEKILIQAAFNGLFPEKPILSDSEADILYEEIEHQRNAYSETGELPQLFDYEKHFETIAHLIEKDDFEAAKHLLSTTPQEAVNSPLYVGMDWELHQAMYCYDEVLEAIDPYKDYRLCYAEHLTLWFTSDLEKQRGDDWNDADWTANAGLPYCYEDYGTDLVCLELYDPIMKNINVFPAENLWAKLSRSFYLPSVNDMNKQKAMPWVKAVNTDEGVSCDLFGGFSLEKVLENMRKVLVEDCLVRLMKPVEDGWEFETLFVFNEV